MCGDNVKTLKENKRRKGMFTLQLSRTAQKALYKLPMTAVEKIFAHLEELKNPAA